MDPQGIDLLVCVYLCIFNKSHDHLDLFSDIVHLTDYLTGYNSNKRCSHTTRSKHGSFNGRNDMGFVA